MTFQKYCCKRDIEQNTTIEQMSGPLADPSAMSGDVILSQGLGDKHTPAAKFRNIDRVSNPSSGKTMAEVLRTKNTYSNKK